MPMPAWFNKEETTKSKANKREAKVFKHLVSGALSWKGDFSDAETLIDNKSTDKLSIRVTEEMLQKLIDDTLQMGKKKAILILDLPNFYVVGHVTKKTKEN